LLWTKGASFGRPLPQEEVVPRARRECPSTEEVEATEKSP